MTGIKRRLGSLLGPAGYNATGAAEDQQTIASYIAARIGTNPVSEALDEAIDAQTAPVRSRANAAHALAQNVSGRVDAFEVLTEITPGNVDDATIASHVDQENSLARESVSRVVFDVSTNLFNADLITRELVYLAGAEEPAYHANMVISDWIPVRPGTQYTYSEVVRATYFDANRQYVDDFSMSTNPATGAVPSSAVWARLTVNRIRVDQTQMNSGTALLPYEPGRTPKVRSDYLPEIPGVQDGEVTPEKTSFFDHSNNLFHRDNVTRGLTIPAGQDTPVPSETTAISDWIRVEPGETYTYGPQFTRITYFNADREYVDYRDLINPADGQLTHTAPENAVWVRISTSTAYLKTLRMNHGVTLLPYEVGRGPKVHQDYLPVSPSEQLYNVNQHRYTLEFEGVHGYYTAPDVEEQYDLRTGHTHHDDVYGWYDQLMGEHPDYITREHIGQSSGIPMYCYRLKPPEVPTTHEMTLDPNLTTPTPAVLIISGTHGYERAAVYNTWRFAKALADEWHTSTVLADMRWNLEFVIIPLGTPSAYNTGVRRTENDVDVARNFPTGWIDTTYSGPHPLSEPEAVAIDNVIKSISGRALLGVTYHNFSTPPETPETFLWAVAASPMGIHLGKKLISRVSREWKQTQPWITNPAPYYGYASPLPRGGTEGAHMTAHGMIGATFESSRRQFLDGGDGVSRDSRAMTLGLEAFVNYVAMGVNAGLNMPRLMPDQ